MATRYESPNGLRPIYIREWLHELGVSQRELADWMETDKANVTRWISEPWRITLDVISATADALLRREPLMENAGILLQPPQVVRKNQALDEAIRGIVENPTLAPAGATKNPKSFRGKERRLPSR